MMPYTGPEEYKPLSPWAYWGLSILYAIPVVGFVFLIVFSFSNSNIHRRNFTRSYWCNLVLSLVILALIIAVSVATGLVDELLPNLQNALAQLS